MKSLLCQVILELTWSNTAELLNALLCAEHTEIKNVGGCAARAELEFWGYHHCPELKGLELKSANLSLTLMDWSNLEEG